MFSPFNALAAALWLYLPALVANSAPVLIAKLPFFHRVKRPIWAAGLGSNKTWAGLIGGTVAGVVVGWLQIAFTSWPYEPWLWIGWSTLISFGALFADAAKSWFKRRIGIPPGGALPVVDGIDYVVGALIFGLPLFVPSWEVALALFIAGPILSLLANIVSYSLGLKKVWY
jgi:CDP-2,3-bis-(O-geranylgeranyl)-sn-glycerol synthase